MNGQLKLEGIDGSNPLGFLSALGTLVVARNFCSPNVRLCWAIERGAWRPVIHGYEGTRDEFVTNLNEALNSTSDGPFQIEKKLPFAAETFRSVLRSAVRESSSNNRRSVDLLAGFGCEVHFDDNGVFKDTAFRVVRSGDSAGQGLPAYALAIRKATDAEALRRTLFQDWDYRDDGYSLRWDPIEDQRYALRWYDPKPQANKKFGPRTMRGANALALEALALFPVQPQASDVRTTGFSRIAKGDFLTWPIWSPPIPLDAIRSLLSLSELNAPSVPRLELAKRGIVEVYRCERVAPNMYYKNFAPGRPV